LSRAGLKGILVAVLLAQFAACSQPLTVEQQIIAGIREMEARVEDGQSLAFMQHVDKQFVGQNGALNHDQVRALLILQLKRYQRLQAQLFPIDVTPAGEDAATATFRALVTGGPNWIPESGQVYEFHTSWRKVDGDWLLLAADWTPVNLEEVF
jgi:hypothetical protein